jgi:surface polysaccharide O-acyltransferase-like enzyme
MESEVKVNKTRLLWPDLVKAVAIFMVICIHTLQINSVWLSDYVLKICQTSIPLFIMVSGALLLGKKESYQNFYKKRIIKVLIPWIMWTLIYMLIYYFSKDKYVLKNFFISFDNNAYEWVKFFYIQFLTGLWFLPLIFGIYLITPALKIFVQNAKRLDFTYILIIWFIFVSILPFLFSNDLFPKWLPSIIFSPIQYSGYFILGYFILSNKKSHSFPDWIILPILLLFAILPLTHFLDPGTVICAGLLFIFLFSISSKLNKYKYMTVKKIIHLVGKTSFGIYIVHGLLLYVFGKMLLSFLQTYNVQLLYTVFIFLGSLLLVLLIQKTPILRHFLP